MTADNDNPLLGSARLPPFSDIRPEHVVPAVSSVLGDARRSIDALLRPTRAHLWTDLVAPIERLLEGIDRAWSPIRHLHAVRDEPALRAAHDACLPLLSDFHTELAQNRELSRAYAALAESADFQRLDEARKRVVSNALREFRLGGVALEGEARARFKIIESRLAELASQFANNVLDATQAWKRHVSDADTLRGLPASALALARQAAASAGLDGWLLTLDLPSYLPVMSFADDAGLRRDLYDAYVTRASDQGPNAGKFDNGPLIDEILALRHEKSRLLGFASFAELSLQRKMARDPDEVSGFLRDLAERARPVAEAELAELAAYARDRHGVRSLDVRDIPYYSEKLKHDRFGLTQEDLRPYFPLPKVLDGMFAIAERLFGVRSRPVPGIDVWHDHVRFFELEDASGERVGELYLDLYAREHKRGGAWMDVCRSRCGLDERVQTPVAYLTCNFTPPLGDHPALITHDEVTTLFHEFGHGLHHLLTRVDIPGVAGIAGVEWDAVELPSQFLENWCYEARALALISAHHETGEPLPATLLDRLRRARNFQAGLQMLRQIEFALFDLRLHMEYQEGMDALTLLDGVRGEVAVIKPPAYHRFPHAFTHVFSGGYAAGYYSYKWAEVLSSDAFARFEERGLFDPESGAAFKREVLERGGSRDALASFVAFRGREPQIDALLRHHGIASPAGAAAR